MSEREPTPPDPHPAPVDATVIRPGNPPPSPSASSAETVLGAAREPAASPLVAPPGETPPLPAGATVLDPAFAPTATDAPHERLGPYQVEARLGEGGMGVVYRGTDTRLGRPVAIKFMRDGRHASAEERERFLREPRATARLQHPGIVQVYDTGEADGAPWFAMEYLEGSTLGALLSRGTLPFRDTAALLRQAAEALQFAHDHGVIHRDLKPENIMVVGDQPKLMDFGLAKSVAETSRTVSGTVMGTPHYMPPEQAAGQVALVDARSDVYSLGVVLFQCLTGRPPFEHADPYEVLARIKSDEPPLPRRLRADVPRDLEKICLKAMAKERARRYPNARELADDLGRYLDGLPVLAVPPSAIYRLRKLAGRHRRIIAAVSIAVAAMSLVVGWQVLAAVEERARQALARERRAAAEGLLDTLLLTSPPPGRLRACRSALDEALALAPEDADLRLWRARAHERAGDRAAALADTDRILAADPRHAGARLLKAWLHHQRPGEADAALAALNGWEAFAPAELAPAGPILRSLVRERREEAAAFARQHVDRIPTSPEYRRVLFAAIQGTRISSRTRDSAAWVIRLLDEDPHRAEHDATTLGMRVWASLVLDAEEDAVAALKHTLEAFPGEWLAAEPYVGWLRHSGRFDDAERWLDIARTAGMPEAKAAGERLRIALGRGDRARAHQYGLEMLRAARGDVPQILDACKALDDLGLSGEEREEARTVLRTLPPIAATSGLALEVLRQMLDYGLYEEAAALLEGTAAAGAPALEVHEARAWLQAARKERASAIEEWTRVLELDSGHEIAYAERARLRLYDILTRPGTGKQVLADLTHAIDEGHPDEDLLLLRAGLRFLSKKRAEAVADIAEYALRFTPHDFALEGVGFDATQAKAFPWLAQNLKTISPEVATELIRRGDEATAKADWAHARHCFSQAQLLQPDRAEALVGLALCATRDDPLAAVHYLERAVAAGADAAALREDLRFVTLRPFAGFRGLGR